MPGVDTGVARDYFNQDPVNVCFVIIQIYSAVLVRPRACELNSR